MLYLLSLGNVLSFSKLAKKEKVFCRSSALHCVVTPTEEFPHPVVYRFFSRGSLCGVRTVVWCKIILLPSYSFYRTVISTDAGKHTGWMPGSRRVGSNADHDSRSSSGSGIRGARPAHDEYTRTRAGAGLRTTTNTYPPPRREPTRTAGEARSETCADAGVWSTERQVQVVPYVIRVISPLQPRN